MKVVALIPFWSDYHSLDGNIVGRSLLNISGKSLIKRSVELLNDVELVEQVIIFASNDKVIKYLDDNDKFQFVKRKESLDSESTSIEDIIESFLENSDAEIVVLLHPKSPFLKTKTIHECIKKVSSGKFDSAFLVNSINKHIWYKGERLNYSKGFDTPSLSEIEPILVETSSVYVFTRKLFNETRSRIGLKPFIKKIDHFEGFEVERLDDFKMVELIINAGLDKERT
jgi:CMP-N-acetylneuraminic acid synthetase